MANVTTNTAQRGSLFAPVLTAIASVKTAWVRYRVYRETLNELNNLSTRELDDIGLSRAMISDVAWDEANRH